VLFLGTGSLGADALRFPSHPNITVRQLPFCPAGWRQKLHYAWFTLWVLAWTLRWCPAWVYASDPLVCPAALLLSYFPSLWIIYHEHDSPKTGNSNVECRISKFLRFVLWSRQKLAQRSQLCILPNERRADWFAEETGNNHMICCVWNCPAQEEVCSQHSPYNGGDLWVLYHGSIVPPRLPLTVLSALAMLPQAVKLRVIGYETVGHSGYIRRLQEKAYQLGLGERTEFLGTLPTRGELFEWCRRSDVGMAFMPRNSPDVNEQTMTGASNKPFDYLACGLALLVSDLPDWREMYVEPGYGLACNPEHPENIAAALHWFLEHPAEMRAMGERGRRRILTEWNYETQFSKVYSQLCKL
jgi:glycosyltransferase involved in cell wall biosynthesis